MSAHGTGGRRRRVYRRRGYGQSGAGFMDFVRKGLQFAKDNKLATMAQGVLQNSGLDKTGIGSLVSKGLSVAQAQGYGRRMSHRTYRRHHRDIGVVGPQLMFFESSSGSQKTIQ